MIDLPYWHTSFIEAIEQQQRALQKLIDVVKERELDDNRNS
jgi:hypothetical protein